MVSNRNESIPEFREIISPMPSIFNSVIVCGVSVFIGTLISLGFLIKMPEQIVADVRVISYLPPITLKSTCQGKLKMLLPSLPCKCDSGEYIAMIENSANPHMIKSLKSLLDTISTNNLSIDKLDILKNDVQLGEVEAYYFKLKQALIQYDNLKNKSKFQYEAELYTQKLNNDSTYLNHLNIVLDNSIKQYTIRWNAFQKDSILFRQKAILEAEYDISQMALLNSEKQLISVKTEMHTKNHSIYDTKIRLNELYQEYNLLLENAKREIIESYFNLKTQIKKWETTYIFMSKTPGIVDFYNLISDGTTVQIGEPVFDIVFPNSKFIGIASLNADGAGKIKKGQQINIKLFTYPFQDYGTLDGIVERISLNTVEEKYLLYISLPNGLISTTGQPLFFAETMYGEAEIITENKSAISRIYSHIFKIIFSKNNDHESTNKSI